MRMILVGLAGLTLASCGTAQGDRGLSGALIGGGIGVLAGGGGVLAGAIIGGGVGMLTTTSQINLGRPIWDQ